MTSFMLSALAKKYLPQGATALGTEHPYPWLVWEPGAWRPPDRSGGTLHAVAIATPASGAGEALALSLTSKTQGARQVSLGRAPTNDLEINDGTLSSMHLLFMEAAPGLWTVRDAGSRNGTWVEGVKMQPGVPVPLRSGIRLQAGQVCLTFYPPAGLFERLATAASATPPRGPGSGGLAVGTAS